MSSPRGLEAERGGFRHVGDEADAADRRRRQDAGAHGLVVERDIAGDDREIERPRRFADALEAADELAHRVRLLGIAEIEIVGQRQRLGADGDEIAPGLGDRLLAALDRVGLAIALVDVGRQREPLGPVAEPDHRRVAAGALHGVAEDQRVVLLVDPALRAEVRASRAVSAARRRWRRRRRRRSPAAPGGAAAGVHGRS